MSTRTPIKEQTRVTATGTWTEILGATKGLSDFTDINDQVYADALIVNFATDDATILVALTDDDTPPAADTDAIVGDIKSQYGRLPLQLLVTGTQHVWIKSDQNDTRALVTGFKEVTA